MKHFFSALLIILTIYIGHSQSLAETKSIIAQHVYLRTPMAILLDSIELDLPSEGTLWSKFDGYTNVSYGDVITLATHLTPYWESNDGNVSTYALDSTHVQKAFSHSRTWKVEPGKQKIYAMAHNWTDRLGNGFADISGKLTVIFTPDQDSLNAQNGVGFYVYPFDFKTPERVVKKMDIPTGTEKYFCVSYDGSHFGLTGDRIEYQISTDTLWRSDLPHKDLGFTSIYNSRNISMQTCFERDENARHLYLLGNKTAGNLNTKENAVYSNIVFNDSANDIIKFESAVKSTDTVIASFDFEAGVKGKLLIRTTGSTTAADDGSFVLGMTNETSAQILDTAIVMQSYSSGHVKEYFSFTQLVNIVPGKLPFYFLAKRLGSNSGISLEGEIYYQFLPDPVVSSEDDAFMIQAVSLFPNPGNQVLNIKAENTQLISKMSVYIFDTKGKLWIEDHTHDADILQVNVSQLPAALYHVVVQVDGKFSVHNYIHE